MNNNDNPSPAPSADQAAELAALKSLHALAESDEHALANCQNCPLGQAILHTQGFEESVAAMTASLNSPTEPSPDLKSKIFAAIGEIDPKASPGVETATSSESEKDYHFIGAEEGEWQQLPGGKIRLKALSDSPDASHTTLLLEAEPGAVFLPHAHEGMEEVLLLSGDLDTVGRRLGPGDYLRHNPNTIHSKAVSENGCRALVITARENHPRRTIGVYNELKNLVKGFTPKSN